MLSSPLQPVSAPALTTLQVPFEGMRHAVRSRDDVWFAEVIHPLRPEAKLSATDDPLRVLISEYDVELLTRTDGSWESTTLFAVGTPPGLPSEKEDSGGCSMAGADPATGLGQVLLVMLALALVTPPRLAGRRGAAHDGASRPSPPSGRSW